MQHCFPEKNCPNLRWPSATSTGPLELGGVCKGTCHEEASCAWHGHTWPYQDSEASGMGSHLICRPRRQ